MLKFHTTKGQEVHVAPEAIREIIIYRSADRAAVHTEKNQYETDVNTAETLLTESRHDKGLDHLATSINRLTEMIRARVR